MKHYVSLDNGINWLTAEEVVSHKGWFSMGHLKIEFISESSPIFRTAQSVKKGRESGLFLIY